MKRLQLIQQIYERLAKLEIEREEARSSNTTAVVEIDKEIAALRLKLSDIMNSVCPIIKD